MKGIVQLNKNKLTNYTNKQAIREILGSLLQEPSLIREYKIVQNDFPETFHKLIFAAINNLYKNGAETIDSVTIDEYLSHYEVQYQVFIKNEGIDF
jgi:replicative DNA helicase